MDLTLSRAAVAQSVLHFPAHRLEDAHATRQRHSQWCSCPFRANPKCAASSASVRQCSTA